LWQILLKYLTPIRSELINTNPDEYNDNEEYQKMLQRNFYNNNQTVVNDIIEAVASGDAILAHRLAHTLKGNAGLLGKTGLRNAASEVEALLRDGIESVWENKIKILKAELVLVLDEYKPLLEETTQVQRQELDVEQTLALFEKLKPMLENDNPECVDLLGSIRAVSGAETLVQQIENYNFKEAARQVAILYADLKNKIGDE
jgi:HPt (histidine-containing phosphotransfer) domain-containing protein